MSTGVILIVIGLALGGGALIFAIINMMWGIRNQGRSFGSIFTGHLGAMVVMIIGLIVGGIGIVMVGVDLAKKL